MQFPQYEDIAVSRDMDCPQCGKSSYFDESKTDPRRVGWCDTRHGFMIVCECPHCFSRYRFHISTTGRWDKKAFYRDFALSLRLYNKRQEG